MRTSLAKSLHRIPRRILRHYRTAILLFDIALVPVALRLAFELRYGPRLGPREVELFIASLPWLIGFRALAYHVAGTHRGSWRHVGTSDLGALLRAILGSAVLMAVAIRLVPALAGISATVLVIDTLLTIVLAGGSRFAVRSAWESWQRRSSAAGRRGKRTLIVGSAEAAEHLLREWAHGGGSEFEPVGVVDDDPGRRNLRIHGVATVGTSAELKRIVARLRPELIVIAVLRSTGSQMRDLLERCRSTGVELRIIPRAHEVTAGSELAGQLREVRPEDLLGRDVVALDLAQVREQLHGRSVLITGGAGSIGSELARQVLLHGPSRLLLLDQAETPLYFTHLALRGTGACEVVPIVGSVADRARVRAVFEEHRPDVVFHAAAYKHVPMMEDNVGEAIRNNVFGTLCVAEAAAEFRSRTFVLISTDKAVHPACVMGASKRIAERIVLGLPRLRESSTDFRAVRFGNVLNSNGSVIPLFERQLAEGRALTVTDPEVTRFFMTISEAVQLVLQASTVPEAAGRICILHMGEPVRIVELAEAMIRARGLRPYRDIPIEFIGLRPGEKLHEELSSSSESTVPTRIRKVHIVQMHEPTVAADLERDLTRLLDAALHDGRQRQLACIASLVPECVEPLRSIADGASAPAGRAPEIVRTGWARPAAADATLTGSLVLTHGSAD